MIRLFRFLKPYRFMIIGVIILVFIQTLGDLLLPTLNADVIDEGVMKGDTDRIIRTGGLMLIVAFGSVICAVTASFLSSRSAAGFGKTVRTKIFKKVESFSLYEFDKLGTSTLITRTTNDITQIQMVLVIMMRMMIAAPLMAIGGTLLALSKDKPLTLVLAVAIPLMVVFITLIALKVIPLFKLIQQKVDKVNLVLREKLSGVRVIRAFSTEKLERDRFSEVNNDLTETFMKANKIMAFAMPVVMVIMSLTQLAIIWFGGVRIGNGDMQLGSLAAFTQYAMQIMFSFLMMTMMFVMIPRARAASIRVNEVLDTEASIIDKETGEAGFVSKGCLEFKNVSFRYHGAEELAIKDISFKASSGEVTAIIGSTGSGKSTLTNLIPRFYDVEKGEIFIDGVEVREMSQECLRNKIGLVPQQPVLFSGSVKENIKVGKENATDEEVEKAAEIAQAVEFVEEMDDGFDHMIDQGGANLSGGQKQRLSIARALVRQPEIYIFDDSFSALDYKTDAKLRSALRKEIQNSTVLIIAQRVGTVMNADRIIVLEEGEIVGMGKHKELLENCEVYKEIVASQLAGEEIA